MKPTSSPKSSEDTCVRQGTKNADDTMRSDGNSQITDAAAAIITIRSEIEAPIPAAENVTQILKPVKNVLL